MEALTTQRTPDQIGREIRALTHQAKCITVYYGVEIGRRLVEAKERTGHGAWGEWVKRETEFSQATANRFMRVFEEYGAEQIGIFGAEANSSTLQNLSVSNALRLLAVPPEEREAFAEEVDAAHLSARELEQAIRERDAARREAETARAEMNAAGESREKMETDMAALKRLHESARAAEEEARSALAEARAELNALRERPVEVAVQDASAEQLAEARAAAAREWKERLEDAQRQIAALDRERQELERRVAEGQTGGDADGERDRLAGEVETLKRQLALSDGAMVRFQAALETMSGAFSGVEQALDRLEPQLRERMCAAAGAQLELWKKTLKDRLKNRGQT